MPPVNDAFADAILLNPAGGTLQGTNASATSDGANDPLVNLGYGTNTVWYTLASHVNNRTLVIGTDAPTSGVGVSDSVLAVLHGATLAGLILIARDDDSGPGGYSQLTCTIPYGETIYVEVGGYSNADQGGFTLTWSITTIPPSPINPNIDPPGVGLEIKTPGAPYTTYPDGSIAVRASSFMGAARGTLTSGSDSTSPCLTYIADTQIDSLVTTPAGFFQHQANVITKGDTINFLDIGDAGCQTGISYRVYMLIKLTGTPAAGISRWGENFYKTSSSRFYYNANNYLYWFLPSGSDIYFPRYSSHQWQLIYVADATRLWPGDLFGGSDNSLRIRAFTIGAGGVELRIAQLIFIPYSAYNNPDWVNADFAGVSGETYYNQNVIDVRSDALGTLTRDKNSRWDDNHSIWNVVEYQDLTTTSDAEVLLSDLSTVGSWNDTITSTMTTLCGAKWFPAITIEDDTFNRTVARVSGTYFPGIPGFYTGSYWIGFGRTTYGYAWSVEPITNVAESAADWGYSNFYGAGEMPAWVEMVGTAARMHVGGYDTGVYGIRAKFGDNQGAQISTSVELPPRTDNMGDYIIEGRFWWEGTLDSTDAAGAIVGTIGKHVIATGGNNGLVLEVLWLPDNTLTFRLVQRYGTTYGTHVIDGPLTLATGFSQSGQKIRMKISRQRCILKGKVWFDGDTEPGWQLEGYIQGLLGGSFVDHPYGNNSISNTGFSDALIDNGYHFMASQCNLKFFPNGGQSVPVDFYWDKFKLSYDPDGDTTSNYNFMIKNRSTTWVTKTTIPSSREAAVYCGKRQWGAEVSPGGQTIYEWVDSGAAVLMGSSLVRWYFRKVHAAMTVIGTISMRWRKGRS